MIMDPNMCQLCVHLKTQINILKYINQTILNDNSFYKIAIPLNII